MRSYWRRWVGCPGLAASSSVPRRPGLWGCCIGKSFWEYESPQLTSESLPPRPTSLFRREAGGGRFAQLDGPLFTNGVDRWRLDVSNTESRRLGVLGGGGGPFEGGRLGWTEVPTESELEERDESPPRLRLPLCSESDSLPSSELRALSGALSLEAVRKAMNSTRTLVVASSPGVVRIKLRNISSSSFDSNSTLSWTLR